MSPPHSDIPVLAADGRTIAETGNVDAMMREVYEHNKNAIVQISVKSPNGNVFGSSGVLVKDGDNVVVVTNAHVANNARSIEFHNTAGETFSARLDKLADSDDLAVLKPEGAKINPARAVDIGDPSKLSPGEICFAIGHPRGYFKPTISQGKVLGLGPISSMSPEIVDLTRDAVNRLYSGHKGYEAAGQAFLNSPHIDALVGADHGSSGGGLFDRQGKLVGVVQATTEENRSNETLSVSSDRVKALLNDPNYKFEFKYGRERVASQDSGEFAAKVIGLGALAASPVSRRIAAPVVGGYYGLQALDDIRLLAQDNLFRSKAHYAEKLVADGGAFAAGMLTFVPRFRLAASLVVGTRLAVDALTDYTDTRPVMEKVERRSADTPEPLFWKISHY